MIALCLGSAADVPTGKEDKEDDDEDDAPPTDSQGPFSFFDCFYQFIQAFVI